MCQGSPEEQKHISELIYLLPGKSLGCRRSQQHQHRERAQHVSRKPRGAAADLFICYLESPQGVEEANSRSTESAGMCQRS